MTVAQWGSISTGTMTGVDANLPMVKGQQYVMQSEKKDCSGLAGILNVDIHGVYLNPQLLGATIQAIESIKNSIHVDGVKIEYDSYDEVLALVTGTVTFINYQVTVYFTDLGDITIAAVIAVCILISVIVALGIIVFSSYSIITSLPGGVGSAFVFVVILVVGLLILGVGFGYKGKHGAFNVGKK